MISTIGNSVVKNSFPTELRREARGGTKVEHRRRAGRRCIGTGRARAHGARIPPVARETAHARQPGKVERHEIEDDAEVDAPDRRPADLEGLRQRRQDLDQACARGSGVETKGPMVRQERATRLCCPKLLNTTETSCCDLQTHRPILSSRVLSS